MDGVEGASSSRGMVFVNEQWSLQRGNLMGICRMCVKSLVDKAAFESITDSCPHLLNFCTVMEHMLTHRVQNRWTLFGSNEPIHFWQILCKLAPPLTITNVQDMQDIQTDLGRGRAWIRLTLVQKKLATFVDSLLSKKEKLTSFYNPGAFLLSDLMTELAGTVKCLDAIDFNLCLRGQDFDFGGKREICYAPYLRFRQSTTSIADDSREEKKLGSKVNQEDEGSCDEEESLTQLRENFISERDQKNYFEELVSVRDMQLSSARSELTTVTQESERQKKELEEVVLELQQQISSLQTELRESQRKQTNGQPEPNSLSEGQPRGLSPRKRATSLFASLLGNDD